VVVRKINKSRIEHASPSKCKKANGLRKLCCLGFNRALIYNIGEHYRVTLDDKKPILLYRAVYLSMQHNTAYRGCHEALSSARNWASDSALVTKLPAAQYRHVCKPSAKWGWGSECGWGSLPPPGAVRLALQATANLRPSCLGAWKKFSVRNLPICDQNFPHLCCLLADAADGLAYEKHEPGIFSLIMDGRTFI